MTRTAQIISAPTGFICEHYDGRRSKQFNARWKADLLALWLGDGWFVREQTQPVLIIPQRPTQND